MTRMTEGTAIVERVGWEEGEHGARRFTATLVFENGPSNLPFDVVWSRRPVQLVLQENANDASTN